MWRKLNVVVGLVLLAGVSYGIAQAFEREPASKKSEAPMVVTGPETAPEESTTTEVRGGATPSTTRPVAKTTTSVVLVQRASSDAEIAALRSEVASLRAQVDALAAKVQSMPPPTDVGPLDRRLTEVESQVGIHDPDRRYASNIWSEIASLRRCDDTMQQAWNANYPPSC